MNRIDTIRAFTTITLATALVVAGCSEATSQTPPTTTASASEAHQEAAATQASPEESSGATEEVAAAPRGRSASPTATTSNAAASAPSGTSNTEATASVNGLEVRRLVVAHDVENREPVGSDTPFIVDGEPVFAFVELANASNDAQTVQVTFEPAEGRSIGPISLEVPANVPPLEDVGAVELDSPPRSVDSDHPDCERRNSPAGRVRGGELGLPRGITTAAACRCPTADPAPAPRPNAPSDHLHQRRRREAPLTEAI